MPHSLSNLSDISIKHPAIREDLHSYIQQMLNVWFNYQRGFQRTPDPWRKNDRTRGCRGDLQFKDGYHIDKYILQLLSRLTKQVHRLFPIKEEFRLILWGGICPRGAKHCMLTAFELVLSVIAMVRGRSGFPLDPQFQEILSILMNMSTQKWAQELLMQNRHSRPGNNQLLKSMSWDNVGKVESMRIVTSKTMENGVHWYWITILLSTGYSRKGWA